MWEILAHSGARISVARHHTWPGVAQIIFDVLWESPSSWMTASFDRTSLRGNQMRRTQMACLVPEPQEIADLNSISPVLVRFIFFPLRLLARRHAERQVA
jgi:hypothetical protein